ncbi:uncharacterized protein LOC115632834 [Scaptodrosophila lebanonensis]|uniref:Uncharacterized protein LOC115632834 n=1 Tax=Drosophila lebanonensis TaxID=7225 RepID=A0A6J2UC32_DROLE|nr:uncharacterized protein LOC115632834 [Scaptodrosophila lebanonensis]
MSNNQQPPIGGKSKSAKLKKWIRCCPKDFEKDVPKPPAVRSQSWPRYQRPVQCKPIERPPKVKPPPEQPVECVRSKSYRSYEEKHAYMEQEVVPVLMEGLLALARDQPRDPISYLETFWVRGQHKCDIQLPQNLL